MAGSFEEHLKELEAAVAVLEGGEATLERSLALFEEAVAHLRACQELLEAAERRVKILVPDEDGEIEERDFEAGEEE
ncbi:MAG: exodeoxyribonuclease VII small subunit [Planctomycetes bacterium]|jgi:exodeoxyribonuclease VII small subunit|nr:exodeoxyribonuclease VII small subunit [Planctomycetota bacterium]